MWIYAAITAAAVAAMVLADYLSKPALSGVAKLIASSSFLAIALMGKAYDSPYGIAVLIGLTFCWLGDACLISRGAGFFKAGLASFLIGHLAYCVGFYRHGFAANYALIAALAALAVTIGVVLWLRKHVESGMRLPVYGYAIAITAMVALAAGTVGTGATWLILAGAAAFYVSDFAVAYDRFVKEGFWNRAWGLPVYYAAQIMIAYSVTLETTVPAESLPG